MKLKVVLDRVVCRDTEDIVGADEFYVSGAVATDLGARAILTKPMDIKEGQDLAFDAAQRVIFEGELPESGNLVIDLTAWDSDFGKDWNEKGYRQAVKAIADALAQHAATALVPTLAGAAAVGLTGPLGLIVVPIVAKVGVPIAREAAKVVVGLVDKGLNSIIEASDPDDLLGSLSIDIPVADLGRTAGITRRVWGFKQGGVGISTWDYDVHYSIHIEP